MKKKCSFFHVCELLFFLVREEIAFQRHTQKERVPVVGVMEYGISVAFDYIESAVLL